MKLTLQLLALYPLIQAISGYKLSTLGHPKFNPRSNAIPSKYLLEFETNASTQFLDSLKDYQDVKVHHTYDHKFFQGLSIEITNADNEDAILKSIMDHPGIAIVTPNEIIKGSSATVQSHKPLSAADVKSVLPHELHQVDRVRKEFNLTGEGVYIGIIDSGIDYRLPALGGGFGEGYKVVTGADFIGYTDASGNTTGVGTNDPIDLCPDGSASEGHGTHVAGTIAGYDPAINFEGVAPGAKLAMWRGLGCDSAGTSDSLTRSALAAYDAGVDILSLSIGNSLPWTSPLNPLYKVFDSIAKDGVLVVIAAANDGASGAYSISSFVPNTFSVASVVNKYKPNPLNFRATGVSEIIHAQPAVLVNLTEISFVDGDLLIPFVKTSTGEDTLFPFCTSDYPNPAEVKGKVVVVDAANSCGGTISTLEKLGAAGVTYILSNELERSPGNSFYNIPVSAITISSFKLLYDAYKKTNGKVRIEYFTPDSAITPNRYENTISLFSSVGPTGDMSFSPNIAAVGENVYSTVPIQFGRMAFMSGTSMATPYVSGALALYLQYHGIDKSKRDIIRAKIQNYAAGANLNTQSSGILDNPLRQGSGYVQLYDSITQTVYVSPPDITLKDSTFVDLKTQELTITNEGSDAVTYKLYNNVTIAIQPYNREASGYTVLAPSGNVDAKADVSFSQAEVTVNPGESQTVSFNITPPATNPLDHIMYGGFIQFSPITAQGSNVTHKPITVPYYGIVGAQRDLPIIDTTTITFQYEGPTLNYTHTGVDEHPPTIVEPFKPVPSDNVTEAFILITYKAMTPSEAIFTDIIDTSNNEVIGSLPPVAYTSILAPTHEVYVTGYHCGIYSRDINVAVDESETVCDQVMSSGTYAIRISALKLTGDIANDADYETWTSIPFTLEVQSS